jgi:4-amino-4-deoxychorismate lyase
LKITRPDLSFVNGVAGETIPVTDRGLHYGDGLFETILCLDGKPVLEQRHLERLFRDAARLRISMDPVALAKELEILLAGISALAISTTGVLKIVLTRAQAMRGYAASREAGSQRLLQFYSGLSYPKANRDGIRVALGDYHLPENPQLAGIKHLNRLDQVFAHTAIQKPFYQEALLCSTRGDVIEGTISNIFMVKGGMLLTPALDKAGVRGVMRDYLLDVVAPKLNLTCCIERLLLDDVLAADELFVCNSVFGVWPVMALNVKQYAVGEITRQIQQEVNTLGYPAIYAQDS